MRNNEKQTLEKEKAVVFRPKEGKQRHVASKRNLREGFR